VEENSSFGSINYLGRGIRGYTGQARAFALAQPKKRTSPPRGRRIKRWGVVVALKPAKLINGALLFRV
jgi:hypothetical protein